MTRIAILGGGIAGLAAAYELELQRKAGKALDWHLYEAGDRLGGTVQTTRRRTADGEYILEGGPDAWVTEKPWARALAEELGLGAEIIPSNDEGKKTYVWVDGDLVAMPERMRMMVPEDLETLEASPLFSAEAKAAYARELQRADALKGAIPAEDESVASFVARHFGEEVLDKIGAPLLSGVFGGDVAKLSAHAVLSSFTAMEAEHGSLILALGAQRRERGARPRQAIFTTLRRGMGSLTEALVAALPPERLHLQTHTAALTRNVRNDWLMRFAAADLSSCAIGYVAFDHVLLATPIDTTRALLRGIDMNAAALVPQDASSAVLATFCWPAAVAQSFSIPPGFGFLVPQHGPIRDDRPKLLAGTFTTQKFAGRAPAGARVVRVFFGGAAADALNPQADEVIAREAWRELLAVLPDLPPSDHALTTVSRWPRSLPQYEVGHKQRMADLEARVAAWGHLHLLGNGFRGVGVPDLIRDARDAARSIADAARSIADAAQG